MIKKVVIAAGLAASLVGISEKAEAAEEYTVRQGDTLSEVAAAHNLELADIAAANPQVKDLNVIYIGDQIKIGEATAGAYEPKTEDKPVEPNSFTAADSYETELLSRLVEAEAQGESYKGKVAVAEVVLNRVAAGQFPNSIHAVIYQSGQFSPVTDGRITMSASVSSKAAVSEAMAGTNLTGGALYFYNPAVTGYNGWFEAMQTTTVIGNHTFKK